MAQKIPGVWGQRPRVATGCGVQLGANSTWGGQITIRSISSRLMASPVRS